MISDKSDEMFIDMLGKEIEPRIRTKNEIAMECLELLYRHIPFGTEIEVSNGMVGRIKKFFDPREEDETICAGIDMQLLENGVPIGEIEFTLKKTGWGFMVAPQDEEVIRELQRLQKEQE